MNLFSSALLCLLSAGSSALSQQTTPANPSQPGSPSGSVPAKAAAASPAAPAGASAAVVATPNTLMDGTAVKLRLAETITSANAKVGQSVSFEVVDEVDVMGVMVVPKGAQALATVTEAQSKRSMGRGGKLDVNIDSMRLADGEKAALRATEGGKGGGRYGGDDGGDCGDGDRVLPGGSAAAVYSRQGHLDPEGDGGDGVRGGRYAPGDGEVCAAGCAGSCGGNGRGADGESCGGRECGGGGHRGGWGVCGEYAFYGVGGCGEA